MTNATRNEIQEKSNHRLLGEFLRSRRESLDPVRLGLPRMRHRRTPGLRREEVAQLADVGVTWYTWLEQGREIKASAKTLTAIAAALQCNEAETQHLFRLAGQVWSAGSAAKACERLSAHTRIMLDSLNPLPAVVQNQRFDIMGHNQAWARLMNVDVETLPEEERNCMWLAFNHPGWRSAVADWHDVMPQMVAMFRAQMGEHLGDPVWEGFLERLLTHSSEFRDAWQRYELRSIENRVKYFQHPQVGRLALRQNNWWSAPRNGDRLMVYIPDDEASARALQHITSSD
ncbi:MAG: helix-turn-helix transcriptional regulator [Mixta calida]|uniref:helix-turn-helix transcriptional regulator n=1 Tax=Mixta calida TaxID=665913 RepID=UPI000EEF92EF|nr:helix-turn-helix transcriptional regulator [Mixta calida]MDU4290219.1 helix-turn-helix transcriptional regulator [Mixta calida]MDU4940431.1 helix-turn-helix transcriptional regulator [Mixta calida]MDU6413411.1 helix-turn-helix transcriptional regulator [Mixta calida]HCW48347.1 transcriptional regulator [Erwiniaceae bacterium]